ncbi:unnamed protein product [Closterium sp. NIES-64]|nr:unnamed protein product [Closterium sp. NIES-64]
MEWLTSAEGLNARQELEASVREHHPHLCDEEVDLIVDGRLLRMVRERAAGQAPTSSQQGGTGEGGAVHEAPRAVGIGGGALAPTIDTGMIGTSYGQFKFGVEHISVTPLLEGRHDLTAWTQLAQIRKGDDETAESYCNRARTIRAELLTIGQEVHMATFAAHVLKGLPPEYGFLRRKLEISSPDMTVERVCSEVLMEEQTLSIEQSYKQITSDASAFLGAVNTIVATTGVNEKEGKRGREQTDGKREKKRAPFKGRSYNCNEEGHMAANLKTYAVGSKATPNLWHARLGHVHFDAVKRTATSGGMFGMDLEKGVPSLFPEPHDPEQNLPPPRTVIVVPVPSVQGGEKPLECSVGPLGTKAPTAPPPPGPPSVADSTPVGPEDGPLEVDTSMADHEEEEEEEAVDEQSPMAHEHEPSPAVPPFQPIPPPPRHSSRPNKGVPPVRFQPSAMTALDADDEDNPYDVAYLAEDECDTDSDDEVEYPDEDEEEEGAWGGVILDLAAALTRPEGPTAPRRGPAASLDAAPPPFVAALPPFVAAPAALRCGPCRPSLRPRHHSSRPRRLSRRGPAALRRGPAALRRGPCRPSSRPRHPSSRPRRHSRRGTAASLDTAPPPFFAALPPFVAAPATLRRGPAALRRGPCRPSPRPRRPSSRPRRLSCCGPATILCGPAASTTAAPPPPLRPRRPSPPEPPKPPEPPELPEPPEPLRSRAARAACAAEDPSRPSRLSHPSRLSRLSRPSRPSRLRSRAAGTAELQLLLSCPNRPVCVLAFDAQGRAIHFEVSVDDLQLFLQCDRADGLSLFDLTSRASPAPAADADPTVRSQWATRDAAARLAVRCHLPTSERAHFSQYKSAQTLYDAVVARYSSPATAALSRLMLPYLFPDLAAFPTVADLITHLRTS